MKKVTGTYLYDDGFKGYYYSSSRLKERTHVASFLLLVQVGKNKYRLLKKYALSE